MNRAERRRRDKAARKTAQGNCDLASQLIAEGRRQDAEAAYRRALELQADFPQALSGLSAMFLADGRAAQAARIFRTALEADPGHVDNLFSLAGLLAQTGDIEGAVVSYIEVIEQAPQNVPALTNLGNLYAGLMRFDEAIALHSRALEIAPDEATVLLNLGLAYHWSDRPREAIDIFCRALNLKADDADILSLAGSAHMEIVDAAAALDYYDRVSALKPDDPETQSFRARPLLIMQEFEAGYRAQEYADRALGTKAPFEQPEWRGQDLTAKSIVVWAEEGVGDVILFAQCLGDLAALAAHCTLVCDARLVALLARSFPGITVLAKPGSTEGDYDFQIGMSALPRRLRPDLQSFPRHQGYLKANAGQRSRWRGRIEALGSGKKIGLFWRSSLLTVERHREYPMIGDWAPVLALPGVSLISLQYGDGLDDLELIAKSLSAKLHIFDDIDLFNDLDGSAALISELDLVITPQSATAWMAGALGRPTWLLNRPGDWRQFGTDAFPWLPSVRPLTKPPGSAWADTLASVAAELDDQL